MVLKITGIRVLTGLKVTPQYINFRWRINEGCEVNLSHQDSEASVKCRRPEVSFLFLPLGILPTSLLLNKVNPCVIFLFSDMSFLVLEGKWNETALFRKSGFPWSWNVVITTVQSAWQAGGWVFGIFVFAGPSLLSILISVISILCSLPFISEVKSQEHRVSQGKNLKKTFWTVSFGETLGGELTPEDGSNSTIVWTSWEFQSSAPVVIRGESKVYLGWIFASWWIFFHVLVLFLVHSDCLHICELVSIWMLI